MRDARSSRKNGLPLGAFFLLAGIGLTAGADRALASPVLTDLSVSTSAAVEWVGGGNAQVRDFDSDVGNPWASSSAHYDYVVPPNDQGTAYTGSLDALASVSGTDTSFSVNLSGIGYVHHGPAEGLGDLVTSSGDQMTSVATIGFNLVSLGYPPSQAASDNYVISWQGGAYSLLFLQVGGVDVSQQTLDATQALGLFGIANTYGDDHALVVGGGMSVLLQEQLIVFASGAGSVATTFHITPGSAPYEPPAGVPEPATLTLALAGAAAVASRKRR